MSVATLVSFSHLWGGEESILQQGDLHLLYNLLAFSKRGLTHDFFNWFVCWFFFFFSFEGIFAHFSSSNPDQWPEFNLYFYASSRKAGVKLVQKLPCLKSENV